MKRPLQAGQIVRVHGFTDGELGFIYEYYYMSTRGGVSVITESGRDLGGFSETEAEKYLEFIYDSGYRYKFENVMKLANDHRDGLFTNSFAAARSYMASAGHNPTQDADGPEADANRIR